MSNLSNSAYDQFSSEYDRFVNWNNRLDFELPFLTSHLSTLGAPAELRVLDAACGTGMHAIALAQRGYHSFGTDLSAGMIERARANAAAAGQTIHFSQTGFGHLAGLFPPPAMDAVLCLGNSLPHILSPGDLNAALADFAASLRSGGLLIIQNRNFDAVMSRRERWMEPQSHLENGIERIFVRFYDYLPDGLIDFNILTLKRGPEGPWQQQVSTTRLAPLLCADLVAAVKRAGFTQLETYGGLNGSEFDPSTSGNLVLTARKV